MISGCVGDPITEIRTVEVPVNPEYQHPADPAPLDLNDPEWFIVELEDGKYAAIKLSDYQLIVENYTDLHSYIKELRAIVKYYRSVTGAESSTEN